MMYILTAYYCYNGHDRIRSTNLREFYLMFYVDHQIVDNVHTDRDSGLFFVIKDSNVSYASFTVVKIN